MKCFRFGPFLQWLVLVLSFKNVVKIFFHKKTLGSYRGFPGGATSKELAYQSQRRKRWFDP